MYIVIISAGEKFLKIGGAWSILEMAQAFKKNHDEYLGLSSCEIINVFEDENVIVEEGAGFKVGDKVTWAQDFRSRLHPITEQGVVETIYMCVNCESGFGLKVSFYNSVLSSGWIKLL